MEKLAGSIFTKWDERIFQLDTKVKIFQYHSDNGKELRILNLVDYEIKWSG
jgi:hypothetical protein